MDNNFSNILDIFKRLDESSAGTMADAEHHKSGPKFGGYWKGTQKSPPKPGQGVGGCEEDVGSPVQYGVDDSKIPIKGVEEFETTMSPVEAKLRALWAQHKKGLQEYGAYGSQPSNTAQAGGVPNPAQTSPQQQQADADAQKKLTNIVGQAKNKGLLAPSTSTTTATQTVAANPALNKATGQQKQVLGQVDSTMNAAMQKAAKNPQAQGDLNTAMSALQRIGKLPG